MEDLNKSADRMLFFNKELADKFSAQATQYSKLLIMCNPGKTTPGDIYQYIQDNCPDIMKDFTESDRHAGIEIGN